MCLIAFAWQAHPRYDLIVAANRDEFHERPTRAAHWWPDAPTVYGGRDERAGGAWCAADRAGRFAAVTNVREPGARRDLRSRGALVYDALTRAESVVDYCSHIADERNDYGPFNLLLADRRDLLFRSNRGARQQLRLTSGIYAISNGHWDEDWPKTRRACGEMEELIRVDAVDVDTLLALLAEQDDASTDTQSDIGIGPNTEQFLSSLFIRGDSYGTRASTVILRDRDGKVDFHERAFDRHANRVHDTDEHWSIG